MATPVIRAVQVDRQQETGDFGAVRRAQRALPATLVPQPNTPAVQHRR